MAGSAGGVTPEARPFGGAPGEWNAFVAGQAGATHAHRFEWMDVIRDTFGHQTFAWEVRGPDGALQGVLPLVRVRTPLFGHYLVSMPFLNAGGPLGTAEAVQVLAAEAARRAATERVKLLELRSRIELPVDLRVSRRKITVVRALPPTTADLMQSFPAKLRSQVRRAGKDGVTVRFGANLVADFHRVFACHMRDLGTPVMPRRFFEAVASRFGEDAWFGCAYLGETPIAAGAGVRFGREFEITWASALRAHSALSPNMALYWAFMERAVETGCDRFDFGRCTPGSGTHRFKRQWGGEDLPLWWYQAGSGAAATPNPDQGGLMALAPRLWQRLPLAVANCVGPYLVKGIP